MSRAVLTRCLLLVCDPLLWNVLHHPFSEEHQGLTLFDDLGEGRGRRARAWGWREREGGAGIEWEQETKVYNHIIWQIVRKENWRGIAW